LRTRVSSGNFMAVICNVADPKGLLCETNASAAEMV